MTKLDILALCERIHAVHYELCQGGDPGKAAGDLLMIEGDLRSWNDPSEGKRERWDVFLDGAAIGLPEHRVFATCQFDALQEAAAKLDVSVSRLSVQCDVRYSVWGDEG